MLSSLTTIDPQKPTFKRISKAGKIVVSTDVVSGIGNDIAGESTHDTHETHLASVTFDLARSPEIDTEDVERAAEGPGKDELAVANDSSIGSNGARALEDPTRDVLLANRPKEAETDAVRGLQMPA